MGRSLNFNFSKDVESPGNLTTSQELSKLVVGQIVELKIGSHMQQIRKVCRSVSTYCYEPSSTNVRLIVDNIDYCENFHQLQLRCIVFRDINILPDDHIYSWCVTTDGYERETENYGISGEVLSVNVIN